MQVIGRNSPTNVVSSMSFWVRSRTAMPPRASRSNGLTRRVC